MLASMEPPIQVAYRLCLSQYTATSRIGFDGSLLSSVCTSSCTLSLSPSNIAVPPVSTMFLHSSYALPRSLTSRMNLGHFIKDSTIICGMDLLSIPNCSGAKRISVAL
eukprot:TRINITY_DN10230_c0_g1_i4.p4 TRINITY_DN10230_c0_g1~~TRINITY_DN10230_c0_g1_i4.p4  ORF type:complete len:108 (+),score=1.90 TRINITY_DN10230_c0_g1_i4:166-489(+)